MNFQVDIINCFAMLVFSHTAVSSLPINFHAIPTGVLEKKNYRYNLDADNMHIITNTQNVKKNIGQYRP